MMTARPVPRSIFRPVPLAACLLALGLADTARSAGEDLERVASFDHQVTGVAVSGDGRTFVNFPRWTEDVPVSVAELADDGTLIPYPNDAWNAYRNAKASEMSPADHFVCVQAVQVGPDGDLWVLDPAAPGNAKALPNGPKLVRIDLDTNEVVRSIPFGRDVALQGSYLNDVRFGPDGATAYITDSGLRGALVVVDLEAGTAFRALDGHPSTQAEPDVAVTIDGEPLRRPDGRAPVFAADGIALSNDGETLYWQALTGETLYSIDTAVLSPDNAPDDIAAAVVTEGTTDVADGLLMSEAGTLYVTGPTDNSVKRWTGDALEVVVKDDALVWPDTLAQGPDGTIYVTASHIQDSSWFDPDAPIALTTELYSFDPSE